MVKRLEDRLDGRFSFWKEHLFSEANGRLIKSRIQENGGYDEFIYTISHSMRVAEYAGLMADMIPAHKFTEDTEIQELYKDIMVVAGALHDYGKFDWPTYLLTKKRNLDEKDWDFIYSHPEQGPAVIARLIEDLVKDLPDKAIDEVVNLLKFHHERYDGVSIRDKRGHTQYLGYPGLLAGEDIPLGSRILKIVDAFDAMVNKRPYRDTEYTIVQAKKQLIERKGTEYDAWLVELFVSIPDKKLADIADYRRREALVRSITPTPN